MSAVPKTTLGREPGGSCQGFGYLEFVIVIAMIAALMAIAVNRLFPYFAAAERVAVLRIEGQLRNVLVMEAALRIVRGEAGRLIELDRANPMALVLTPPHNYLGELKSPALESLPPRSWHFDSQSRRLVYRAGRGFDTAVHEYAVRLVYGPDNIEGVRLTHVVDDEAGAKVRRKIQVL